MLRNRVMIEAFGTGQRIRGRRRRQHRPTLVVCDDLQNDGHIQSALTREHSRSWFHGMLMKAGTKRTTIVNIGTALHRECLAMELARTPGWQSRIFRAIENWPLNMPLWHEWEQIYSNVEDAAARQHARAFYETNRSQMDAGAVVLWPEEEDLYTLMCMRAESGRTAFDREKQSLPVHPDLCEWPEEYFGDFIWFDTWPDLPSEPRPSVSETGGTPRVRDGRDASTSPAHFCPSLQIKVIALDPSKGADSRHGDYSAFVMLGVAGDGTLYVEADLARRPMPNIIADGVELCRRFRPHVLGVETNQFQELLAAGFAQELKRQGLISTVPCSIENTTSKLVRIRRLGPLLAAHRLRFKADSPSTRLLVEQLKDFPLAAHDDGPDALEMALRLAEARLQPRYDDGLGNRLI